MEKRLEKLEQQVQRLHNVAWVIGVLAVVFGVSGGWGLKSLTEARSTLKNLRADVAALSGDTATLEERFVEVRSSHERQFDDFVRVKRDDFNRHTENVTQEVHDRLVQLEKDLSQLNDEAIRFGNRVSIRNESFKRCMDLRGQDHSVLQLLDCRGVSNQVWTLDRR